MADETQPEVQPLSPAPSPEPAPSQQPAPAAPEPSQEPAPAAPLPSADPSATPASPVGTEPQGAPVVDPAPAVPVGTPPAPVADPTPPAVSAGPTEPAPARPVLVNQYTRRSDEDALLGSWVDVVAGEYAGRKGAYVDDDSHDPDTGYPQTVLVRTRDAENELIAVNYSDIRPSAYTGGR